MTEAWPLTGICPPPPLTDGTADSSLHRIFFAVQSTRASVQQPHDDALANIGSVFGGAPRFLPEPPLPHLRKQFMMYRGCSEESRPSLPVGWGDTIQFLVLLPPQQAIAICLGRYTLDIAQWTLCQAHCAMDAISRTLYNRHYTVATLPWAPYPGKHTIDTIPWTLHHGCDAAFDSLCLLCVLCACCVCGTLVQVCWGGIRVRLDIGNGSHKRLHSNNNVPGTDGRSEHGLQSQASLSANLFSGGFPNTLHQYFCHRSPPPRPPNLRQWGTAVLPIGGRTPGVVPGRIPLTGSGRITVIALWPT